MLVSLMIIGSQYAKLSEEPVFVVTVSLSSVVLAMCALDIALILARKGRRVSVGITSFQIVTGLLWAGLFLPIGLILILLNVAVLVGLREKKTPEELLRNPPVSRTKNYKISVGSGVLVMLASLFLPWFSDAESSVSMVGVYSAILTQSGDLPNLSIGPGAVVLAVLALAGTPAAVVFGALALRWRKLAFVFGAIAVVAGAGAIAVLSGAASPGAFVLVAGGSLLLVGFFGFKGAHRSPSAR